jgi:prefoldin subunit 5
MDIINEQINQLMKHQTHILNAIKDLDERMTKVDDKELEA